MEQYKSVSIIIPVFNERRTIEKIIDRVLLADTLGLSKEIILVDDGSTDDTRAIISKLHKSGLKKLLLDKNYGKGYALRQGFSIATGDIVIVQDADLEYNPDDYPVLLSPFLAQGAKVVYGSRELNINKHSYPVFFIGGKIVTLTTKLLFGGRLTDVPTGYKAFDRLLLKKIPLKCMRFEFCPEVTAEILKREIRITEVPIRYKPRRIEDGKKIKWQDGIEAIITLVRVRVGL